MIGAHSAISGLRGAIKEKENTMVSLNIKRISSAVKSKMQTRVLSGNSPKASIPTWNLQGTPHPLVTGRNASGKTVGSGLWVAQNSNTLIIDPKGDFRVNYGPTKSTAEMVKEAKEAMRLPEGAVRKAVIYPTVPYHLDPYVRNGTLTPVNLLREQGNLTPRIKGMLCLIEMAKISPIMQAALGETLIIEGENGPLATTLEKAWYYLNLETLTSERDARLTPVGNSVAWTFDTYFQGLFIPHLSIAIMHFVRGISFCKEEDPFAPQNSFSSGSLSPKTFYALLKDCNLENFTQVAEALGEKPEESSAYRASATQAQLEHTAIRGITESLKHFPLGELKEGVTLLNDFVKRTGRGNINLESSISGHELVTPARIAEFEKYAQEYNEEWAIAMFDWSGGETSVVSHRIEKLCSGKATALPTAEKIELFKSLTLASNAIKVRLLRKLDSGILDPYNFV